MVTLSKRETYRKMTQALSKTATLLRNLTNLPHKQLLV